MFEKEAKERYYKNYPVTLNIGEEERYKKFTDIWKDGAAFAYNKANEWHDLRKNPDDLPKDGATIFANNLLDTECVTFNKEEDGNHWKHDYFELCGVVYWKEIILPELKEAGNAGNGSI